MPADHVTVTLEHKSGLVRDQVVNNFCFANPGVISDSDRDAIITALDHFYNDVASGAPASLSSFIGNQMSRTAQPVVRFFDITASLSGTPSGSPVKMGTLTHLDAAANASVLPTEVACALSFHSEYNFDVEFGPHTRPRARDRGRIYVGPLSQGVIDYDLTTFQPKVIFLLRDTLNSAAQALWAETQVITTRWAVWSRKAARTSEVIGSSVDDAFDIQRRRGERAIAKSQLVFS